MAEQRVERLLVDLRDDGLVQVSSWPAGERLPRPVGDPAPLVWPLSDEELVDLRWYLERYLRLPTAVYGERGERVAAELPRWGEAIFSSVFGDGPGREAYTAARTRGGPVEITLLSKSPEQLGRPWELMAAPGRGVPVALDGVALTRSLQSGGMAEVFDAPGTRLRVLMVISRPGGTDDVGYQMIARPLLRRLEAVRGKVELVVLRPPTLERLREVLADARAAGEPFQVVHFDGHGVFGMTPAASGPGGWGTHMYAGPGPQGMLAFEKPGGGSDLVEAGRVAQVLAEAKVPLVVLNACQSAQVGAQVEASVATRLLAEGCASVVAMAYSVYAVAAAEFMTAFYERLFAGEPVTDAVRAGRAQLVLNALRPSLKGMLPLADWMIPVLYTRGETRFPELRSARESGDIGAILTRIREASESGAEGGADWGRDLEPVGEFVGRDADFYTLDVAARLQHVVVVHGPGGTGKSELAKAFGRWWRDTGGVEQPELVLWHSFEPGVASFGLDGVVTSIGLRVFGPDFAVLDTERRQAAVEELLADHRLLLLWDNFESVREMPDPGRATPPLSASEQDRMRAFLSRVAARSKSAIIITSRTPETWLGAAIRRVPLAGLTRDDATAYAEQLLAPYPDAHRHRQSPAFADLMQWLDGHPLSMKLTLPRLSTTTARHLLDGLQGLTAFPDDGEDGDRHTSLAASIAYSFQHLSADDQQALTILSLFHGVADAAVLAAFSGNEEAPARFQGRSSAEWRELLDRAAVLGLVTSLGAAMFRLHPALPAHLAAHWTTLTPDTHAEEQTAALRALVSACASFSMWLSDQISGGDAQLAFTLVAYQQRMLGAMLGQSLASHQWTEAGAIVQPLNGYWDIQGLTQDAQSWTDRIRTATETPDGTTPELDTGIGSLWMFVTGAQANRQHAAGQLDRAENTHQAILRALVQQESNPHQRTNIAVAYHQLGGIAQDRGRPQEAEGWYRKSLTINEDLGNRPGMATSYHQLGMVAQRRGRLEEAEGWYRKSLTINEDLGNRPGMATSYHQLGIVAQHRGQLDEAENWYTKSLTIKEDLGNRPGIATSYHQLGIVAQLRGQLDEAENWYTKSLTIKEDLGDRPGIAITYHQLGIVAQLRGQLDEAENWYTKSLTIEEDLGDRPGMATSYHQLGIVAQHRGQLDEAENWYTKSLTIEEDLGNRPGMAITYHELGRAAQSRGRQAEAEDWYRKSLTIKEDLGNRPGMALTYAQLGLLAEDTGGTAQALVWVIKCVALFDEVPHPRTGTGPTHLRLLTQTLGIEAVESAWQRETGNPLPDAVRTYVLAEPDDTDPDTADTD
ncbi:tetratricopeptide repeat protein [Actinacidiphila alni]|uniref:tetratricopeptide repeat protein n=1 Tax=Actinacidiphila alni TaxID=380248 RepID=UPI003452C833